MPRIQPPPANLIINASPLATLVKRSRDVRDQKLPAIIIVDHITGRATWNNAEKYKQDPLTRLDNYFTKDGKPFAHYCIGPWGRIVQIAYERERPWAQGLSYGQALQPAPSFWKDYWGVQRGLLSVVHLMGELHRAYGDDPNGNFHSPNDRSIAIEHVQYGNGFKLTGMQYRMSHMLHLDIAMRHGMDMAGVLDWRHRLQVLGHEDVNPWERGTKAGGWDPGALRAKPRFCWRCLLTLDFTHGGQLARCPAVRKTPEMPRWLMQKRGLA
jgi:hypothetical protein